MCKLLTNISANDRQKGFSLVEIMVALAISLVVLEGIFQIMQGTQQSNRVQNNMSQLQSNARLITDLLIRDISASGYMGCLNKSNPVVNTLTDKTPSYDFASPIYGVDGGVGNPDSITIRRANEGVAIPVLASMKTQTDNFTIDDTHPNYASLKQWDVITVSDCSDSAVLMITNDVENSAGVIAHETGATAPVGNKNEGQSNATKDLQRIFGALTSAPAKIYFVGSNTYELRNDRGGVALPFPSLFLNGVELVQGVGDLQIQYGVDSNTADNIVIADSYVDAPVADWNKVISIKLTLTLNSIDKTNTTGDGRIHKTVTSVLHLRNNVTNSKALGILSAY